MVLQVRSYAAIKVESFLDFCQWLLASFGKISQN